MKKDFFIPVSSVISIVRAIRRVRKLYKKVLKEKNMANFELGITVGEITAMLPNVLSEAWEHYSDDKNISVDEALEIVGVVLNEMAEAADSEKVKELFLAIGDAVTAVGPFVSE